MEPQIRGKEFFEKYIIVHEKDLFRYSLALTKNPEHASDILQNTMLQAWIHLDQLKDVEKAGAWLFKIADNEAKKLFKQQNKEAAHRYNWVQESGMVESDADPLLNIPDSMDDILEQLVMGDSMATFQEALGRLNQEDAALIKMRYLDELEPKEIGLLLNQKPNTVRSALCRAMKKMRDVFYEIEGGGGEYGAKK